MKLDAKTVTAIAALVTALAGGVELRVQVGLLTQKVQDLDSKVTRIERQIVSQNYHATNE